MWYREHGGLVLGFAINKYCYISLRPLPPFFEHRHRIVYSIIETVQRIEEIRHPVVRSVMSEFGVDIGVEIHHDGDLPARSGLGSSSAFTVGLLNAFYALNGRMISHADLAREAIRMEQNVLKENVGSQDQVWAAYGGMNRISFFHDDRFEVAPLIVRPERSKSLLSHLILVFTGVSRIASQVAEKQIVNLPRRGRQIHRMVEMVDEATAILTDEKADLTDIGRLLHEGWRLKRELADNVSTPFVDEIYDAALGAGAIGGKLLGAGGGGFLLLFAEPDRQAAVREVLRNLIEVKLEIDTGGAKIVVYEPEGLRSK